LTKPLPNPQTNILNPHLERLIDSLTSVTGHTLSFEPLPPPPDAHTWDVVGTRGDRYGVLAVRAEQTLTEPQRALYAQLSEMIAHDADLRHANVSLEKRFGRLDRHNAELTALNRSLSATAYRDSLTGVYRRWYVVEQIHLELLRARRYRWPLSLLLFNVDRFAMLNDRVGAPIADTILREMASRIVATCRTSDVVGRVRGDEFCAVLPGTPSAGTRELARRVQQVIAGEPFASGKDLDVLSVSFGCATFEGVTADTADSLLEAASQSLNRARHAVRQRSS
jgi:diguanylate cyclase (GGDEF)-like protein